MAGSSHADGAGARRGVSPAEAIARRGRVHPDWFVYFVPVSDLPLTLPAGLASTLLAALDQERKIDRALATLGPVADRDVAVIGGGPAELERLRATGARVSELAPPRGGPWPIADGTVDTIVSAWSAFRGVTADDLAEADRVLRPEGRLLVIHDYGRDDVSRLRGDLPDYGLWSRRDGPFIRNGFRLRVLHCFWTFESAAEAARFLREAFGEAGSAVARELRRPRLSYNVAIYHRTRGAAPALG